MRGPQPLPLTLSDTVRHALPVLTRTCFPPPQRAGRAQIMWAAADAANNAPIARRYPFAGDAARRWRTRRLGSPTIPPAELRVEEHLTTVFLAGRPSPLRPEVACRIAALACAAPSLYRCPLSQWSGRPVADVIAARSILL